LNERLSSAAVPSESSTFSASAPPTPATPVAIFLVPASSSSATATYLTSKIVTASCCLILAAPPTGARGPPARSRCSPSRMAGPAPRSSRCHSRRIPITRGMRPNICRFTGFRYGSAPRLLKFESAAPPSLRPYLAGEAHQPHLSQAVPRSHWLDQRVILSGLQRRDLRAHRRVACLH